MPFNPNATATIQITGLALCRYFQNAWEILFLHPDDYDHLLEVTIIEKTDAEPPNYDRPKFNEKFEPGESFEVSSTQIKVPNTNAHRNDNWLDATDMVWLMHLDELHPPGVQLKNDPLVKHSYLSVSGGVAYTADRTPDLYKIKNGSWSLVPRQIGYVFGIDLECQATGTIDVKVGGTTLSLPFKNGLRYEITFDNSCEGTGGRDDFHYYYRILEYNGKPYSLEKYPLTPPSGFRSDEGSCNPPTGGNGSRISFLEAYKTSVASGTKEEECGSAESDDA